MAAASKKVSRMQAPFVSRCMKDLNSIKCLENRFHFEVSWHMQATRHAAEGLIGIASDGHAAAIVEVPISRSVLKLAGLQPR